ncbi:MAG: RNA polymerase sigma factor [Limisphaerales bacterium]
MDAHLAIVSLTGSEAHALPHEVPVMEDRSDTAALTSEMAAGNESSYATFFERYFNRLFRYLLAVTRGDENSAEDALQETFTRVAKYVRRFDDEQVFWDWLAVLARSAARDLGRKQNRYRRLLFRFFERSETIADSRESEERLNDVLDVALQSLAPDERQLLELKYFDRSTVRELAREKRTTEKAIESRLLRARRHLREAINHYLCHE